MNPVRSQYERFPYPPISPLALPRRGQGAELRYELGTKLAFGNEVSHKGVRILVAGCGTFEALLVAQAHPDALEIVAVDFSERSIAELERRLFLARLARFGRRMAPVKTVCADLMNFSDGTFDFILVSNVLQHVTEPAALLARLSTFLRDGGLLRMVTYPKASRIFMRETSRWLKLGDITPGTSNLGQRAAARIGELPNEHPVRSCFVSHQEIGTRAGLVDAFLHACEEPLSPLQWASACSRARLALCAETQNETSRSSFMDELLPTAEYASGVTRDLRWIKLQILDDCLELCANPVLWLKKEPRPEEIGQHAGYRAEKPASPEVLRRATSPSQVSEEILRGRSSFTLPSRIRWELGEGMRRIEALLKSPLHSLREAIDSTVGGRVTAPPEHRPLPGLSLVDYDLESLLNVEEPWGDAEWDELAARHPSAMVQVVDDDTAHGRTLCRRAGELQVRYGTQSDAIRVRVRIA